mmetsp:Transcript_17737/g.49207  ORF Transcript_17737/g.49207 Transcript_17737/m.49207 type:complete len:132 (+) Transcript_17737:496-891(+)
MLVAVWPTIHSDFSKLHMPPLMILLSLIHFLHPARIGFHSFDFRVFPLCGSSAVPNFCPCGYYQMYSTLLCSVLCSTLLSVVLKHHDIDIPRCLELRIAISTGLMGSLSFHVPIMQQQSCSTWMDAKVLRL